MPIIYQIDQEAFGDLDHQLRSAATLIEAARLFNDETENYLQLNIAHAANPAARAALGWAEKAGTLIGLAEEQIIASRKVLSGIEKATSKTSVHA